MKDLIRYIGYHALSNGGRRLDFSFAKPDKSLQLVSVEASHDLFSGPDHMAIQECAAICYETLKCRVADYPDNLPESICLTTADVAQHRKPVTHSGRQKAPKVM